MEKIRQRSDFPVQLIQHMGSDESVVWAARISNLNDGKKDGGEQLINYLMRNKHGTPFEHNSMTFRIEAPIFVWREFHRHRVGFSYNEQSGRYTEFLPEFYLPNANRPLSAVGKTGNYKLEMGEKDEHIERWNKVSWEFYRSCEIAWNAYSRMLNAGITREIACRILPTCAYSSCYVTCNARSLMNFLHLRMAETAQWEIRQIANTLYTYMEGLFPQVAKAFADNGYIAP